MVTAIILAAGESGRMGTPKALLKIGDNTFIRHIIETYRSSNVQRTVVVLGAHAAEIQKDLSGLDVVVATNQDYAQGQLSSVIVGTGIAESLGSSAILIHPVDHAVVHSKTINDLVARFRETGSLVVVPSFEGKRGHPVLFSSRLFHELQNSPPDVGARFVVWSHAEDVVEVETDDKGVITDVDTPEQYERFLRELKTKS
jgi:molybdenum cofactor cytidylyltransferase